MPPANALPGFRRSLALLIAIDLYDGAVPKLRTPVADATAIAELLRERHGFETVLLCDAEAGLDQIRTALGDLKFELNSEDRVLVYFAGHGVALEGADGPAGFFLPQDAVRNNSATYLPMVDFQRALNDLPCRHLLAILDCCFAGAFRWSSVRNLEPIPENIHQERFEWFIREPAWQVIASAAHDEKALDVMSGEPIGDRGLAGRHSPFARALLDGLAGEADLPRHDGARDGVITATELFLYLEERMAGATPGRRQSPVFWPLARHEKGQFVFLAPGRALALSPAPQLDADANPWRGLLPYEPRFADMFFGRKAASERLLHQVLQNPLVVVTGPSGIGKSSLVHAGLLPRLPPAFRWVVARPGATPFASLAAALRSLSDDAPDEAALRNRAPGLAAWFAARPDDETILLVVDQAEELVTLVEGEDVAKEYLDLVAETLAACPRLKVVITIRSDFEPLLAGSSLKDLWLSSRYLVPQMTQDELRRVIVGPATTRVMRFESDELVDTLVNEVVQTPGALPLLSFAVSEIYANYLRSPADDRTLTFRHYRALEGGVAGSLRTRANHLFDDLDEACQTSARRVLERLVSVESGDFTRRRVPRRELAPATPEEAARIALTLRRLDEARLIIADEIDDVPHIELAHDALILGWDRLVGWVREDLERIIALRRLTRDADEWSLTANAGLLWDDPERSRLVKLLQAAPTPGLNQVEHRFAAASLARGKRNTLIRWAIVATLCALTIGALWFAYAADQQRRVSDANRLAVTAQLAADLDQSLLLSVAATQSSPGFEPRSALLSGLFRRPLLHRLLHGAQRDISAISVLPGNLLVAHMGANGGQVATWDLRAARPKMSIAPGLDRGVDGFVLVGDGVRLVARRGNIISTHDPARGFAKIGPDLKLEGEVSGVFSNPHERLVYVVTGEAILVVNPETASVDARAELPSPSTEGSSALGSNGNMFFQNLEGVWLRRQAKWRRLEAAVPSGHSRMPFWIDPTSHLVVSTLLATSSGRDERASVQTGFHCWDARDGKARADCPDHVPLNEAGEVGFVSADRLLLATLDAGTGLQRVDLLTRKRDEWVGDTLRLDPTFVTGLAASPDRSAFYVGTIDGELSEYRAGEFAAGAARPIEAGEPLLARWDATDCRVVMGRGPRLDLEGCQGRKMGSLDLAPFGPDTRASTTKDGRHLYIITNDKKIMVWTAGLQPLVTLSAPPGLAFSALVDLCVDKDGNAIYAVLDEARDIWRYDRDLKTWRRFATLPFAVRSISLSSAGSLVAGSSDDGRVVGFDLASGKQLFSSTVPGAEFVSTQSVSHGQSIFVSALAPRHSMFRMNARTGVLESGNLNRFSGPARILAISPDGQEMVIQGVGAPQGRSSKAAGRSSGLAVELWDAKRLLPIGEGFLTGSYGNEVAVFSPRSDQVAVTLSSNPRIATLPLSLEAWTTAACRKAGRILADTEARRFQVASRQACGSR